MGKRQRADNYGNDRADTLANEGRTSDSQILMDNDDWHDNHPALQDGPRLQALNAHHMYRLLLKCHTNNTPPILHQDKIDEAKTSIEQITSLKPMNTKLVTIIRAMKVPPRVKDHMRNMLSGKIKCGSYWNNIQGLQNNLCKLY